MSAAALAGWATDAMIASTLLMALVLLVRAPVRRAFGSRAAYGLWLLPLLRLVLPPLPAAWHPATTPIREAGEALVVIVEPAVGAATVAVAPAWPSIGTALAVCWLGVALVFLMFHSVSHLRFCRRIRAATVSQETVAGISVIVSDAAPGPLAFGIWRRFVAMPSDAGERYDARERALAVAHELSHHRRGDLAANWTALAVLALHWWNPLAWRAFRAFRADQELANDACVLAGRPAADRHAYAIAILKTAHGRSLSVACHLHTIADLKGRLKMLATSPASRRRLASGAAAVGALLVGGLAITASGSSAAVISTEVRQAVGVPPAPPVPPAPEAPLAPPAPPAPEAPVAGHQVKKVVVVHDGKTTTYDSADVDSRLAAGDRVAIQPLGADSHRMIIKMDEDPGTRIEVQDIPAVRSASCGIGNGKPASMTIETRKGEKRTIVICTDRIRKVTADAMVTMTNSKDIERNAYAQALAGLLDARTKAVADVGMSDTDRSRALSAIDTSITEMRSQLARFH